jgi:2-C-methyl-D-erythritol 2,4-cyclodiphosphate synthase
MSAFRVGIGYDIHRTAAGRPLRLAGVEIPGGPGLSGHSDADVVLHALCDALLGAAGLGDIGELFPDTDPAFAGADSRVLVRDVLQRVRAAGLGVHNADVIIQAERPRLTPFKPTMRAALASLLEVGPRQVNIKAGTNEGLGAIGRGEAIACWAAVLLTQA